MIYFNLIGECMQKKLCFNLIRELYSLEIMF